MRRMVRFLQCSTCPFSYPSVILVITFSIWTFTFIS